MNFKIQTRSKVKPENSRWMLCALTRDDVEGLVWALGEAIDGNHIADMDNEPKEVTRARNLLKLIQRCYK